MQSLLSVRHGCARIPLRSQVGARRRALSTPAPVSPPDISGSAPKEQTYQGPDNVRELFELGEAMTESRGQLLAKARTDAEGKRRREVKAKVSSEGRPTLNGRQRWGLSPRISYMFPGTQKTSGNTPKRSHSTVAAPSRNPSSTTPPPRRSSRRINRESQEEAMLLSVDASRLESEEAWKTGPIRRGMVIEYRRSGVTSIGCTLCATYSNSRLRWIVLSSTGDLASCSEEDIQFVFPLATIPDELSKVAAGSGDWIPDMESSSTSSSGIGDLSSSGGAARKNIARLLRRLDMDIEKRLRGLSIHDNFHAETIWKRFQSPSTSWGHITSSQACQFVLGYPEGSAEIPTRLDQYIFHRLMMSRPEYFQGDEVGMRSTGMFSVRPAAAVRDLKEVSRWLKEWNEMRVADETGREALTGTGTGKGKEIADFITEARRIYQIKQTAYAARAAGRKEILPLQRDSLDFKPFGPTSLQILSVLSTRYRESRSTQNQAYQTVAISILKALDLFGTETLDVSVIVKFLKYVGVAEDTSSLSVERLEDLEAKDGRSLPWSIPNQETHLRNVSIIESFTSRTIPEDQLYEQDAHESVRHDFGDLPVYVIDAASAKELDDGVSIEAAGLTGDCWVHVHVADPTRWLHPGHLTSRTAQRRGQSLYLAEGTRPLLPGDLVMEKMSLGSKREAGLEGKEVLTVSAKVSPQGSILDMAVRAGFVRNVKVITYDQVDNVLGFPRPPIKTVSLVKSPISVSKATTNASTILSAREENDLKTLGEVAATLWRSRLKDSGMEASLPLGSVSIESFPPPAAPGTSSFVTGYPDLVYQLPSLGPQSRAGRVVAECMILAGRVTGSWCAERALSVPWRGATQPIVPCSKIPQGFTADQYIQSILDSRDPDTMEMDAVKSYMSGIYLVTSPAIKPIDHWVMGIKALDGGYVRATSPLRRYGDLLAHWQIKSALLPPMATGLHSMMFDREDMKRRSLAANITDKRVKRISRSSNAFWQGSFLEMQLRTSPAMTEDINLDYLEGKVLSITINETNLKRMARVYSQELGLIATLEMGSSSDLTPGQDVRMRIERITPWPSPLVITSEV